MTYTVKRTLRTDIEIDSPLWEEAEKGEIHDCGWDGFSECPETSFRMLWGEKGLFLLMESAEKETRAEIKEENGAVCTDSCMEFFLRPRGEEKYINFEVNPIGVMHIGIGECRHGREHIFTDRKIFRTETETGKEGWKLRLFIPFSFLEEYYKAPVQGFTANLYKCGDKTARPHYGSYAPVPAPTPDFHRPEYFTDFEIE